MKFTGVGLSQLFSEAPGRGAGNTTIPGLLEIFTMNRIKKLKNVAVTGWDLTGGVEAPVYLVGALTSLDVTAGDNTSIRLHLFQSEAQEQASKTPPTGPSAAGSAARCSVFFDALIQRGNMILSGYGSCVPLFSRKNVLYLGEGEKVLTPIPRYNFVHV